MPSAIHALRRRLEEIRSAGSPAQPNCASLRIVIEGLSTKAQATFREVFGEGTIEGDTDFRSQFDTSDLYDMSGLPWSKHVQNFEVDKAKIAAQFETQIALLEEKRDASPTNPAERALRAYADLDLHASIADAASKLYGDGHYANAIVDAVKALNSLVRSRSGPRRRWHFAHDDCVLPRQTDLEIQ
jgi:hypothetical protein